MSTVNYVKLHLAPKPKYLPREIIVLEENIIGLATLVPTPDNPCQCRVSLLRSVEELNTDLDVMESYEEVSKLLGITFEDL